MSKTEFFISNVNVLVRSGAIQVGEIAERSGIHRTDLSRLLSGRIASCTIERADRIAKACGYDLEELLTQRVKISAKSRRVK